MGKESIPKKDRSGADNKERRCLKCGKKLVGRWLCEHCFKQNSTLDYMFGRYEYHEDLHEQGPGPS